MRALVRLVIMDRVRPVGASADFLERIAAVRETRARLPEVARNRLATRHRRATVQHSGLLLLIAVDDPARGVLRVGDDPRAMADRSDLLHRLEIALSRPGVDGIIATADVVEDLLMLECLDDKVVIGSMNRGGLRGAVFELDDRVTAYDVDSIAVSHLDGGKMRCRIDLADPGTTATLEACGKAITGLATRGLMALVEPSMSRRVEGEVVDDHPPHAGHSERPPPGGVGLIGGGERVAAGHQRGQGRRRHHLVKRIDDRQPQPGV